MPGINYLEGPAGLFLDLNRRAAVVHGELVELNRREVDLLEVLLRERGRVVPFEELAERVWGHCVGGDARFIYTAAWRVRRALEGAGAKGVIESVRGVGYVIAEEAPLPPVGSGDLLGAIGDRPTRQRALVVFDPSVPQMRPQMINDAMAELSGYSSDQFTNLMGAGRSLWYPEERELIFEAVRQSMDVGRGQSLARPFIRADDSEVIVDVAYTRLDVPGRGPFGLAEVFPIFK